MKVSAIVIAGSLLVPGAAAYAQGVTDPQIASIVVTANQVDIDAGKLAKSMASSADVKKFADQMITDHTGVNKSAVDLVTKLKVTPEDNPTSQSLKKGGDDNVAKSEDPEGRGVRQGLYRSRGRVSPGGYRSRRQDPDPERHECGSEGTPGEGPPGVCRAPRAREARPVVPWEVSGSRPCRS